MVFVLDPMVKACSVLNKLNVYTSMRLVTTSYQTIFSYLDRE